MRQTVLDFRHCLTHYSQKKEPGILEVFVPLFLPMFFYVLYMTGLGLLNFFTRKNAVVSRQVKLSYMRTYSGDAPERLVVVARHFDNQFQVPILFLITCLATQIYIGVDTLAVILAWAFVVSRVLHSYIHLTSNHVPRRAIAFFVGFFLVVGMWVNIAMKILTTYES